MGQIINKKRFFPPFFIVALFFIFQLFSIMQFVRYAHGFFGTFGYILISGLLSYLIFVFRYKPWIAKFLDSPIPFIIFLILLVAAALIIYPKVDALKLVDKGSDQDDGVIIATTRMLSGFYPYSENTYLGNPISTGPGWLILHTPFVAIHMYILASIFLLRSMEY